MIVGASDCSGIIFYDSAIEGKNGVYAYYEDDEIQTIEGNSRELLEFRKEKEKALKKDNSVYDKPMLFILIFMIAVVVVTSIFTTGILPVIGAILFAIGGYMPILIIYMATRNDYLSDEDFRQFRRYHGAEHTMVNHNYVQENNWSLEEVRKASMYDPECGTAYAQMFLLVTALAAVIVANIGSVGLIRGFGILLAVIVVLLLNMWFNPHNPFTILQHLVVEKPGDRELLLAMACYKQLLMIKENTKEEENITQ